MPPPTLVSVGRTEPTPNPDPGRPRRRTLVVGAALLLLVAGLVAVDVNAGHPQPPGPPVTAPPAAVPAAPFAPRAPAIPARQPQALDLTVPVTTPSGLTWARFAGEWEPYSADAGPAHVVGSVAAGYARSPLGALLAAQQIGTRYSQPPGLGWRTVTLAQVLPGPGRDAYLRLRATVSDAAPTDGYAQPEGFRYVAWTPDQAVLQLLAHRGVQYAVVTMTVRWQHGDWRLELLADGSNSPSVTSLPSPTGFVPWGAPDA